jgi:DnaJ-class molecular chaperone
MNDEGYVVCDKCNGSGKNVTTEGLIFKKHYSKVCNRCYGAGKLNWIENVLGKEKPFNQFLVI